MPFYLTKLRKAIALNKKAIIAAKALTTKLGLNITYIMFEFWLSCRKLFCKLAYGLQNSAVKVKRGLGLKKEKNEFKLIANRGTAEGNTCRLLKSDTNNRGDGELSECDIAKEINLLKEKYRQMELAESILPLWNGNLCTTLKPTP